MTEWKKYGIKKTEKGAEVSPIGMGYRNSTYPSGTVNTYWFEKNLQGDIIAIYNEGGTKLVSYTYDAWGKVTTTYHNGGASTAAQYNPFRYRGYYYDTELGFYYLNSRYYDPETGRFVNADGYVSTGQGILGYNMFAYCRNEPVFRKDAYGTEDVCVEIYDEDVNKHDDLIGSPSGSSSNGGGWEGAGKNGGHSGGTRTSNTNGYTGSSSNTGGGYEGSYGNTSNIKYPGNDPTKCDVPGFEWRGSGSPASGHGNYVNMQTGEWLHPDLNHGPPIGPHWDYGMRGIPQTFRIFPDGSMVLK